MIRASLALALLAASTAAAAQDNRIVERFYDAGKVTDRRGDLNLEDLNRAYGFGFRFNTDQGVIMRVDAGFGSRDGKHLYIVFGDVF